MYETFKINLFLIKLYLYYYLYNYLKIIKNYKINYSFLNLMLIRISIYHQYYKVN